jgi:hypothetical protein
MLILALITLRLRRSIEGLRTNAPSWAPQATIGVLALLLRLCGLGDKPFWLDELASLRRATASVPDLVADSMHSTHFPSYFLILWLIGKIGTSQWAIAVTISGFRCVRCVAGLCNRPEGRWTTQRSNHWAAYGIFAVICGRSTSASAQMTPAGWIDGPKRQPEANQFSSVVSC